MSETLTKASIAEQVAVAAGIRRSQATDCVEELFALMKEAIRRDGHLMLSGFGRFDCYAKIARKGRNPITGETLTLPARKVVVFRISRKFRDLLNPERANR